MGLDTIAFNYLVTNNLSDYQTNVDEIVKAYDLATVIRFYEDIKKHNISLFDHLTNSLSPNVTQLISDFNSLSDPDSLADATQLLNSIAGMNTEGVEGVFDCVEILLQHKVTTTLGQQGKILLIGKLIGSLPNVPAERVHAFINQANRVIDYVVLNKIDNSRIDYYTKNLQLFDLQLMWGGTLHNFLNNLRGLKESTNAMTSSQILAAKIGNMYNAYNFNTGILKLIGLAAMSLPNPSNNAVMTDLLGQIVGSTSFTPRNYVEYSTNFKVLTDQWRLVDRSYSRTGSIKLDRRGIALMTLLSSNSLDDAKKVIDMYGKTYFKYTLFGNRNYYNELEGIIVYKDPKYNLVLNSSIEDLAKLYPSRFFVQTMLLVKHYADILTDADVQWALTHKTNSNIQNGAMLFMETLCKCSVTASRINNVYSTIYSLRLTDTSNNSGAGSQQKIAEQKYNLSYAMYGLFI